MPYSWVFNTTIVDLYVTQTNLSVDPSNPLDFGQQIQINATVFNKGIFPVSNIPVKFYNGTPDADLDGILDPGADEIGDCTLANIDALGSANATFTWLPPDIGRYEIYIWVDPDNLTIETNDWNNTASIGLEVYCWADDFRNETRILSMTNVTRMVEDVVLASPETSGSLLSVPIDLPPSTSWFKAHVNKTDINATYNVTVSILNATDNQPIPGFENRTEYEIDLTGIDSNIYPSLRLAAFFTGNATASPVLHHWGIDWVNEGDPPTFAGLVSAIDNETDGEVLLNWDPATDPSLPITYNIYQSTTQGLYNFASPNYTTQSTNYIVGGLMNGVDYWFVVRAQDSFGNEDTNFVERNATPTGPDNTPPVFTGLASGDDAGYGGNVTLSWSAAQDPDTPGNKTDPHVPITYHIYISTTQGSYDFASPNHTTTDTSFTVQGLIDGVKYWFVVRAADSLGNEETNTVEKNATPTGPDNTSPIFAGLLKTDDAEDGGNVSLEWSAGSDPDTPENKTDPHVPITYNIYISTIQGSYDFASPNQTTTDTSFTVQGLTNGVKYWFVVRAEDGIGNEEDNVIELNATPTGPDNTPPAFAGLESAVDIGDGGNITLTWTAASDPDTPGNKTDPHVPITYNIYISTTQGSYNFASPDHTTQNTEFTVQGLTVGVEYWFVVRAQDSLGNEEGNTIELNATPTISGNTPPVFSGLTDTEDVGDGGNIKLSWTDASDLNVPIRYKIYISTTQGNYNFASPNHTTTSTSFIVEGLENGIKYWFVVRAEDSLGLEEANIQELNATPTGPDTTPPVFIGLVSVIDLASGDAVNLSWSAAYDPDTLDNKTDPHEPISYNIYISTTQSVFDFSSPDYTTQELYYVVDGLTAGTEYWFVVRAADSTGNEEININEKNATPSIEDLPPDTPSGLTALISNYGDAVILEWTPNSELDIAGYLIYRSESSGEGFTLINTTASHMILYTDDTITEGSTYYYVIQAFDNIGQNSTFSPEIEITTNSAPSAPSGLSAVFYTTKTLNITWDANSEPDLVEYVLYYSTDGISFNHLTTIPAGTEYFLHSDLQENTTYYYRLSARDEVPNESNQSETAQGFLEIDTDGDGDPDITDSDDGFDMFILLIIILIVIISLILVFLFIKLKKGRSEPDELDLETEKTVPQNLDKEIEEPPPPPKKEKYPPPPPPPPLD